MDPAELLALCREALALAVLVVGPPVGAAVVAGLAISVVQTATQIQEQTVGFAVRAAAVVASLVIAGPWIADQVVVFADAVFDVVGAVER